MTPRKKKGEDLTLKIRILEEELIALKAAYVGAAVDDLRRPEGPYAVVVFRLRGRLLALPLWCISGVSWAVEFSAEGVEDEAILGLVNFHGATVPVVDAQSLGWGERREVTANDQIIYVTAAGRTAALLVDAVLDVETLAGQAVPPSRAGLPRRSYLGVFETEEGLLPVVDPTGVVLAAGGSSPLLAPAEGDDG